MEVCDAAKRAGVSEQTIRDWRKKGRLRSNARRPWTAEEIDAASQAQPRRGPKKKGAGSGDTTASAGGPDPSSAGAAGEASSPPAGLPPTSTADPKDPYKLNLPTPPKAPAATETKEATATPPPKAEGGLSRLAIFGGPGLYS